MRMFRFMTCAKGWARGSRLVALSACLVSASACSLVLDWSPEELRCDASRNCSGGYSCLGNACKADYSILEWETCSKDVQCMKSLVCSSTPHFGCRKPCTTYFDSSPGNCAPDEYCRPYPIENAVTGARTPNGSCVKNECTTDADCVSEKADAVCVKIHDGASACLTGCEISWRGGQYHDTCGSTQTQMQYCQPIGALAAQRLVCLDTTSTAEAVDRLCKPVDQPCQRGLACSGSVGSSNSKCYKYCDVTGACGGLSCVTKALAGDRNYGLCQ